jgi:hypothetical protein
LDFNACGIFRYDVLSRRQGGFRTLMLKASMLPVNLLRRLSADESVANVRLDGGAVSFGRVSDSSTARRIDDQARAGGNNFPAHAPERRSIAKPRSADRSRPTSIAAARGMLRAIKHL